MFEAECTCPQCSELIDDLNELTEGVCQVCRNSNQAALDDHNHQHDRWAHLSSTDRDAEIKRAHR